MGVGEIEASRLGKVNEQWSRQGWVNGSIGEVSQPWVAAPSGWHADAEGLELPPPPPNCPTMRKVPNDNDIDVGCLEHNVMDGAMCQSSLLKALNCDRQLITQSPVAGSEFEIALELWRRRGSISTVQLCLPEGMSDSQVNVYYQYTNRGARDGPGRSIH
ncbi:hypothetical protein BJV74DRAFT_989757 [Russula compacta]|nr:hypothetical protein BJV74DRAFT_989757 [Russula compacta]